VGGGVGEGADRGVWGRVGWRRRWVGGSACGNLNSSINLPPKFCNPVCRHYLGNTYFVPKRLTQVYITLIAIFKYSYVLCIIFKKLQQKSTEYSDVKMKRINFC
jgi:hypothetical protein